MRILSTPALLGMGVSGSRRDAGHPGVGADRGVNGSTVEEEGPAAIVGKMGSGRKAQWM